LTVRLQQPLVIPAEPRRHPRPRAFSRRGSPRPVTVLEHAGAKRFEDARSAAEPLVAANPHQLPTAFALTHLVGQSAFAHDDAIAVAGLVFAAHLDNPEIVGELAGALEVVRDF